MRAGRERNGITFKGCRLPPGTYQIVNDCIAAGFDIAGPITADALRAHYDWARREHPQRKAPNLENTIALLQWLARRAHLKRVVGRVRSEANPGLPDLFLWKSGINGIPFRGEFIEVKRYVLKPKYREPEAPEQRAEREFLEGIGLRARVLRLTQR